MGKKGKKEAMLLVGLIALLLIINSATILVAMPEQYKQNLSSFFQNQNTQTEEQQNTDSDKQNTNSRQPPETTNGEHKLKWWDTNNPSTDDSRDVFDFWPEPEPPTQTESEPEQPPPQTLTDSNATASDYSDDSGAEDDTDESDTDQDDGGEGGGEEWSFSLSTGFG